jgi:hypothetical protein
MFYVQIQIYPLISKANTSNNTVIVTSVRMSQMHIKQKLRVKQQF